MFVTEESEPCALGEDILSKLPPLPHEHTDNLRTGTNWLKNTILLPPSPRNMNCSCDYRFVNIVTTAVLC